MSRRPVFARRIAIERLTASRRDPLLAALPKLLMAVSAEAAPGPTKTMIVPAKDIDFQPALGAPAQSIEEAHLFSEPSGPLPRFDEIVAGLDERAVS